MKKTKQAVSAKVAAHLLRAIKAVKKEPLRLDMQDWLMTREGYNKEEAKPRKEASPLHHFPKCDTVGCLAGWVVLTKQHKLTDLPDALPIPDLADTARSIYSHALRLLEIKGDGFELFYPGEWPEPFKSEWLDISRTGKSLEAYTRRKQAEVKVLEARVEYYIRTGL